MVCTMKRSSIMFCIYKLNASLKFCFFCNILFVFNIQSMALEVCRPNTDLPSIQQCKSAGEMIGPDNNHTVKAEVCESLVDAVKKETDSTYTCTFFSYRHYYAPDHYGGGEFCDLTLVRDNVGKPNRSDMDCFMRSVETCHILQYCRVYDL